MPIATNAEALRDMRGLHPTSTGRLRGLPAKYARPGGADLRGTPEPWHSRLTNDLAEQAVDILTPASTVYLVFSDNVVIAVLTAAAHVLLPEYPLTATQRRHQLAVADALHELPRHVLRDLADRRASMDGRDEQAHFEYDPPTAGAIRVAALAEPTVTHWADIDADLAAIRQRITDLGLDPDRLIVITAAGYGTYGRDRHRLNLPMLCAMHRIADRHDVTLTVVGDWLDAEGATTAADLDPDVAVTGFADAYVGAFGSERDFTAHRMRELGWTTALQQAGIPQHYLNDAAVTRGWFPSQFRGIWCSTRHRTEVFRRAPG
ncbi:hypothetical protein [Dactylosporangium sp. NPDC049140]|uniref:hypothetical protein n=1 Tax=Dactylosporangium sp. NPDC049140 TaxID=3155647 RepID=UPI0033EA162A